ncbi:hypothetical protein VTI74DRAFT_9511 [Chaetomium olivicolor]
MVVAAAAAIDGSICLAALVGVYDATTQCLARMFDVAPIIMCAVGLYYLAQNPPTREYYFPNNDHFTATIITICVLAIRILILFGSCIGCCITYQRRTNSKKARKLAAAEDAPKDNIELSTV